MKAKRILALALAAWMACSMAVGAADADPQELFTSAPVVGESIACVKGEIAPDPVGTKPVPSVKFVTHGDVTEQETQYSVVPNESYSLPYGSSVKFGTRGQVRLAMNTTVNQAVADKYPHADLVFLNGNGGALGKGATMRIAAGEYRYLYRNLDDGFQGDTDLSNTYNAEQVTFTFPAETLDSYILSDTDLTDQLETNISWAPNDMVNSKVNQLADELGARYKNDRIIVSYGTKLEKMGKIVTFEVKTWGGMPGRLDSRRLRVYAYDEKTGKLLRMPDAKPTYSSRTKSYRFTSGYRGMFVITDSGWKRK